MSFTTKEISIPKEINSKYIALASNRALEDGFDAEQIAHALVLEALLICDDATRTSDADLSGGDLFQTVLQRWLTAFAKSPVTHS